jgi:hypothetical protein
VAASVLIRAATAGALRSWCRQRLRIAPMLPTETPSVALIWALGMGGSWISRVISCWQRGGKLVTAWRSATSRSAASS